MITSGSYHLFFDRFMTFYGQDASVIFHCAAIQYQLYSAMRVYVFLIEMRDV